LKKYSKDNKNGIAKTMKSIEVVAAIIVKDSKCFATQRGYGEYKDWWEFPGGKIEVGESRQEALIREIKEELDADIHICAFLKTIEYDYPQFHLIMHCYVCQLLSKDILLKEHEAGKWLDRETLESVRWLPADLELLADIKSQVLS